jgi:ribonuclease E
MTIDIVSDPTLIIPEYIINIQNKSKKNNWADSTFWKIKKFRNTN